MVRCSTNRLTHFNSLSMAPGAWPLAYGRLPGPGTARHLLVGSSQSPPRPGGPMDRDRGTAGIYLKLLLDTSMTVPMYQHGWGKICQPNSDQGCIIWMVVVSASHCGRRSIAVEALQLSLHLYNPLHLSHPSTSPLQSSTALQPPTAIQLYSYTAIHPLHSGGTVWCARC